MRSWLAGAVVLLVLVTGTTADAARPGKASVRFQWRKGAVGSNRISIKGPRGSVQKTRTRQRLFARQRDVSAGGHQGTLRFSPYGAMKASITTAVGARVEVIGDAEGGKAIGNSLFSSGTREREFTGPGHRLRAVRAANRYLDHGRLD